MKNILFSLIALLTVAFAQPNCWAKTEFINVTVLNCNPEAIRNKAVIEQSVSAIADAHDWPAAPYSTIVYTDNGLICTVHTEDGTCILKCVNHSNKVLVALIKLKGTTSSAELKRIIATCLGTTNIKIQING